MEVAFTPKGLIRSVIVLYLAVWAGVALWRYLYCRRRNQNVHKAALLDKVTVATGLWGWVVGLFAGLFLTWLLPEVYVVTRNDREFGFDVNRLYVPFSYGGHAFGPAGRYVVNRSDETLALYTTTFYNGMYTSVSDTSQFRAIGPRGVLKTDRFIDHKFSEPRESSLTYVSDARKMKSTTELTLTTMSQALHQTQMIREKIRERNKMTMGWEKNGGYGGRFRDSKIIKEQLKRQRDAVKGPN